MINKVSITETGNKVVDVRIVLAVLWVGQMLSSLNGDTYRLSASTAPLGVDPGLLLGMSALLVGSIFMCGLTLTLTSPVSRWANRIAGCFYALVNFAFWTADLLVWHAAGYEIIWATAQLVFSGLIVWYAWKWSRCEP
jgi:hypothetical protein